MPVMMVDGCPDVRSAQAFSGDLAMTISVQLVVPKPVRAQGPEAARQYVHKVLQGACSAQPELQFTVVMGEPNL